MQKISFLNMEEFLFGIKHIPIAALPALKIDYDEDMFSTTSITYSNEFDENEGCDSDIQGMLYEALRDEANRRQIPLPYAYDNVLRKLGKFEEYKLAKALSTDSGYQHINYLIDKKLVLQAFNLVP